MPSKKKRPKKTIQTKMHCPSCAKEIELLGINEISKRTGRDPRFIQTYRDRGLIPQPAISLVCGSIWELSQVADFIEKYTVEQKKETDVDIINFDFKELGFEEFDIKELEEFDSEYKLELNQCFDCGSHNVVASSFPFTIDKTEIIDLPHIYCNDCGTYIISTEFTDPVASVLNLLDIRPQKITMDQIRAADRFGWIKF